MFGSVMECDRVRPSGGVSELRRRLTVHAQLASNDLPSDHAQLTAAAPVTIPS